MPASISPANANLGVGANNDFQYLLDANSNAQNGSLVTLNSSYDLLSAPVTFRFYGWNAEGGGGTFSIDNVTFNGSVTAVPEPSAMAIVGGFGMLGLFMAARRRN
ncbi:MAG: PEP-CTERM sorting domain-containing protein [Verrucomicrobiota bacterium]